MFEYLSGTISSLHPSHAVIDVHGIGFCIKISLTTYDQLIGKQQAKLLISEIVREECFDLYGFYSQEERSLFLKLISISGIGPKTGIGIVGHLSGDLLYRAISQEDYKTLQKIPGIGKKMAERLLIELRDFAKEPTAPSHIFDAEQALISLGYSPIDARKGVQKAQEGSKDGSLSELVSSALRFLVKG